MQRATPRRLPSGFTLTELLITVAAVAILAAVAVPTYKKSVIKSRRADAQAALAGFANAMERHFTSFGSYKGAACSQATPCDTGAPWIYYTKVPIDGSITYYTLTITSATGTTYTLRATPKGPQANDGKLELDHTGARRWDSNNNNSFEASEKCWNPPC
jgi:type IV pilus assembly protein PilE